MKYFFDTEFHEGFHKPLFGKKRHFIDLISIGIVCEDGREYYAISKDFDLKAAWNAYDLKRVDVGGDVRNIYPKGFYMKKEYWLRENVLKPIWEEICFNNYMGLTNKEALEFINIIKATDNPFRFFKEEFLYGTYPSDDWEFTYSNFKKELIKHGKSNKQIAEDIKEFCKSGSFTYYKKSSPVSARDETMTINRTLPEFYGYYADYDWCLFCSLFGRMIDLPKGFPMYAIDLKQMLDERMTVENLTKNHPADDVGGYRPNLTTNEIINLYKSQYWGYPKQENEHNALSDAKWNKKLYNFIYKL